MSAPDFAGASTTTVASVSPLMILFRRGNVPVDGGTSGASSDTTAPPLATIASARRRVRGRTHAGMAATDDSDGRAVRAQRRLVSGSIDPERQSGHDRRVGGRQRRGDPDGR